MTDVDARLAALEQRVALLQDHLDITTLIYTYPAAVDSGSATTVSGLWTEDGVYDVDPRPMNGRAEIEAMVGSSAHQGYIHDGCGHFPAPARVTVDGDTAVAIQYTQLIMNKVDAAGFRIARLTANRWELARGADGWRVTKRTGRVLDGRPESREMLAAGVGGQPVSRP
ncbi:nuclear transport factor 2 family protein [Rhodococcus sp. X156]|uniref:nuclear transport factor 2 family protein n=1 Tax=Rhodococcus sp. X156 TaxID=2499145 RepID=UPI000FDCA354|nr:nuclear transport factor 2 family protein [Rhodococcus sp. X156]